MKRLTVREGRGYRLDRTDLGVSLRIDRIRESSGEVTGELTVERAPDGHLAFTRLNLLSKTTRVSLAKDLSTTAGGKHRDVPWAELLERFCLEVIVMEREGEPWLTVGRMPPRERPPYLMEPFLYERAPTILFGPGGIGKSSVFASAIAIAVATGRAALPGWVICRTGPVVVLDWEADPDDWNDSIAGVCRGIGIDPPLVHYRQCSGPLDGQVNAIASFVERTGAVLVIVDSAEAAMRSPRESGADDPVKRFYDALRQIPSSALVIDHVSKAVAEHGGNGGPIGSVTKGNRARMTWELRTASARDDDGTRHLRLINRKNNKDDERSDAHVAVHRQGGVIRMWPEAPPTRPRDGDALWERIRTLLSGRPMTVPDIIGALGVTGRDPMRVVETAMARKGGMFGKSRGSRTDRTWYLVDTADDTPDEEPVTGQVIAFPGTVLPVEEPEPPATFMAGWAADPDLADPFGDAPLQ